MTGISMRSMVRGSLTGVVCVCVTGCLPRARLNDRCRWTDNPTTVPKAADAARRAHLLEDVRVAQDLGIRYADASAGRMNRPAWGDTLRKCTERLFGEIMRAHQLTRPQLTALETTREDWIDWLAVFLPASVILLAAGRLVIAQVVAQYDREDRAIAVVVLAALTPVVSALSLGVLQLWGLSVEQLRIRNSHISYRAFALPAVRHGWLIWSIYLVLFAVTSAMLLRRRMEPVSRRNRASR